MRILIGVLLFLQGFVLTGQATPGEWKTFSLGQPPLHIKIPCDVVPMEVDVPVDMINYLMGMDAYRLFYQDGQLVAVFKFIQTSHEIDMTPGELLAKELDKLFKGIKAEQIIKVDNPMKMKKVHGIKATGSFVIGKEKWNFQDILLKNEAALWQIWIAADQQDERLKGLMDEIMESVHY